MFINRNVEKKPAVIIKKIGDSCYFGNEEGFDQEEKVYTAKVSSYSCSFIQISKKKIRQNANYEPELMAFIYSQSNKKKVFFEKEKMNVFERNKQMFGKKNNQMVHFNPIEVLTGREAHFRSTSNLEEASVYTQAEPTGTSPGLRMKNYAESLLKAAELYKDPGSLDSAVFEAPKRGLKNQSNLNTSGSDQTKSLHLHQIPTEMSTQMMFLSNNRELLHGTQQPSLIENIQKMQKEQSKHHHITFDGKSQMSSEWSQILPNPGKGAPKSSRNHVGSSMSQEDTFDGQSARAIDFVEPKEAHPIFEAIRIEQEESRNQQQGKLGPRTQMLDQVNQVLIQSMFTEKQQIRMQKKHKTYKPPAHRNSQISEVSWGEEQPAAVLFHVGSSLNNYSSSMVKDIKKLVQSTDMSLIQNSNASVSGPEHLESEVSGITGHLLQLQRGAEFVKVLDLSRADGGGSQDQDSRLARQYPKIYAREQRVSVIPSKDTAMTIQARRDLLDNPGPRGPPHAGNKKTSQFRRYQVANNRSQPTLPEVSNEIFQENGGVRGTSSIVGEAFGLAPNFSMVGLRDEFNVKRTANKGKTVSSIPLIDDGVENQRDYLEFIDHASRSPFSHRKVSIIKQPSVVSNRQPTIKIREITSLPKLPRPNRDDSSEPVKKSALSIFAQKLDGVPLNFGLFERGGSPPNSDKSFEARQLRPSQTPLKRGYKISSSSKGFHSHRKLPQKPSFRQPEEFTRIHSKLGLGPESLVSAHGILDSPVQQSLQLRFNNAAKVQQMQPIKVTELLPRMKQMLRDSVELLASKPQQFLL